MSSLTQDSALEAAPAAAIGKPRPLFWSVRRELWENRSIVVAPLATAAVVLFGLVLGAINLPQQVVIEGSLKMDAAQRANAAQIPFDVAAAVVMVAAFVTGFFYCLGALYGERRDRSILFWKSLPVSDLTTVAAKATVVLAILPIVTFLVVIATHVVLLAASIPLLAMHGLPTMLFWQQFPLVRTWAVLALVLVCLSLWYAPIWGWALVISGWARRVTFLWAVGPPVGLAVFEELALHTHYVGGLIDQRLNGGLTLLFATKFDARGHVSLDTDHLVPARFFSAPELWIGLAVAAALFAAAIWQRRYRSPF